jgi:hypothetical protein
MSPGSGKSTPTAANTHCPPRSHQVAVQRGQRISGGPRSLVDAPLIDKLGVIFFHQLMFDTPRLTQFISCTPKLKAYDQACVFFSNREVSITLPWTSNGRLQLEISCGQSDWQLSSLSQLCSSSFPHALISTVEHLYIFEERSSRPHWQDDIESSQWLELLHRLSL